MIVQEKKTFTKQTVPQSWNGMSIWIYFFAVILHFIHHCDGQDNCISFVVCATFSCYNYA